MRDIVRIFHCSFRLFSVDHFFNCLGKEAYEIGLANRLVPNGTALEHSIQLGTITTL